MSIVIVSVMLVSALRVLGTARAGDVTDTRRTIAVTLAQDLMEEILAQPYEDAIDGDGTGPDAGESGGTRSGFDDVDDYNAWTATPPQDKSGVEMVAYTGYTRSVQVVWALPADPNADDVVATGLKRIEVTIEYDGRRFAFLTAWRSSAFTPGPEAPP